MTRRRALVLLLGTLFLWVLATRYQENGPVWWAVKAALPEVPSITTEELSAKLQSHNPPLLIDAREPEEMAMSRIPGAVPPRSLPKDREVVVYCSIGYRSGLLVQKLRQEGATKVYNLEGSIFLWANQGRALEGGTTVHPFDPWWGLLLRPSKRGDPHGVDRNSSQGFRSE